jgi:hypothetical protein
MFAVAVGNERLGIKLLYFLLFDFHQKICSLQYDLFVILNIID